jgi:hypothetical protein
MPNLTLDLLRPAAEWAEVRANDRVMRYRRAGTGRAIVLLLVSTHLEAPWPELIASLGSRFRLIFPEPPAADTDVTDWLGDFLEGLGMSNVGIVAAEHFCIPTLELTLLGLDQVARVVLVPRGPAGEQGVEGALDAATGQALVPLIVIRDGQPVEEIVRLITRFLAA